MKIFFITSTGTDIGKTALTTTLCRQMAQRGKKVIALKPVISGFDDQDRKSDSSRILQSCGIEPTSAQIEKISPWRYKSALAPNMAAKAEGKPYVPFDQLVSFCRRHEALQADVLLVEGVGGIMAPLNQAHTVLDWVKALGWPVLLVTGSYLGAISHTLTAIEVLKQHEQTLEALFVNESPGSGVPVAETVGALQAFAPAHLPVIKLPYVTQAEELWKQMPPLGWVCE